MNLRYILDSRWRVNNINTAVEYKVNVKQYESHAFFVLWFGKQTQLKIVLALQLYSVCTSFTWLTEGVCLETVNVA